VLITLVSEFLISGGRLRDYLPDCFPIGSISALSEYPTGMIRMNVAIKVCFGFALLSMALCSAAGAADSTTPDAKAPAADVVTASAPEQFQLSHNQRIACSRGLSPGKLNTATCKSYTYLFNVKTSEYFRCSVSLALTRDNKEVINVQADGGCIKKPRIFDVDSSYSFDATETEAANTNAFFGPGGYAVWASDNTTRKIRGCIIISSGLGSDITKCVDMSFE